MDELLTEFLTETNEFLAVIDRELVRFEQDSSDKAILQDIFRLVHTIKGTSGFLGLARLEAVTHAGEDILGKFRDGELEVTPDAVTLILKAVDKIKDIMAGLEESGSEPGGDDSALIAELNAFAEGGAPAGDAPAAPAAEAPAEPAATDTGVPVSEEGFPVAQELLDEVAGVQPAPAADAPAAPEAPAQAPAVDQRGFPVAKELLNEVAAAQAAGVEGASDEQIAAEIAADRTTKDGATAEPAAPNAEATPEPKAEPAAEPKPEAASDKPAPAKESSVAAQSVRVNVSVLENLMTLVGELVLTRNQLLQMVSGRDDSEFKVPLQRLSHITTDVQEGVMKTRMQPIQNAWAKLPRIVRDLAIEMDKKIELKMLGGETELDRQVLELIKDPLTHMVRNSADHGLEPTADRVAAGKLETGTITLNAYHEGGHIIIQLSDDGRGLNIEKIKDKAIANGLATEADMAEMSPQQIHQFIFKPGFSTAAEVTNVSGRGVGMDVVRTNIEKIGGNVELSSTPGKGSRFNIKIPLTLAIVSALIVESGGERFAIPQIGVHELVRVSSKSDHRIERVNDTPVLRLRNSLLPLVDLKKLQGLDQRDDEVTTAEVATAEDATAEGETGHSERFIVVSQVGTLTFGLIVDRVFDTEEIVVKPVAPILRAIPYYSGNTMLGDGSVIMILDLNGIAAAGGNVNIPRDEGAEAADSESATDAERSALLVFRVGESELRAVPLALVSRLEIIDRDRLETTHGLPMVQYRDRLMPLIEVEGCTIKPEGNLTVLVFQEGDRAAGLVVDAIVDIVEQELDVELAVERPGLLGTAIIDGKATDVLDAVHYLTKAYPDWFAANENESKAYGSGRKRMLLVDDSPFFRNLMAPLFSVAGYDVTTVHNADHALELRDSGQDFDVIISDIEMPGMDGFEFAEDVRRDPRWCNVPMVALSAHATERERQRGRQVGFDDYVAKFDRQVLMDTVGNTLNRVVSGVTENVA